MVKYENEEHLKNKIFDVFSKCRNEASSDRRIIYLGQLSEPVFEWCRDYMSFNVENMGLEIVNVIKRIIKDNTIARIPDDKDSFFKYLITSLNTEKAAFYRNDYHDEAMSIKIPKDKKIKLKKVESLLRMMESDLRRELTTNEQIHCISQWFDIQEYNDIINAVRMGSIEFTHSDRDAGMDNLNSRAAALYMGSISNNPLEENLLIENTQIIRNAVKSVLESKKEKSDCYRALYTLYCFHKCRDIEGLAAVLDKTILDACKNNDKKLKQYEIYMKFYPDTKEKTAEVKASNFIKEFKKDVEVYLLKNNPEIFS